MADDRRLLILPPPSLASPRNRGGGGTKVTLPPPAAQAERLAPQFRVLQEALDRRKAEMRADPLGVAPEEVLVLETMGSVEEFFTAVQRVPGLEWLGEQEEFDLPPSHGFRAGKADPDALLKGRLYLILANQQALEQLLSLWKAFKEKPEESLSRGFAPIRQVFTHLHAVRRWDVRDRLEETGLLDEWRARARDGLEHVPFEVELWYRNSDVLRQTAQARVVELLTKEGGRLLRASTISDIAYHALLGELPLASVQRILSTPDTRLVKCDAVMFFRPVGQTAIIRPIELLDSTTQGLAQLPRPQGKPVVALLDGLPLEKHDALTGRLVVDAPEDWGSDYAPAERLHGTAMASLIVHGDLNNGEPPLSSPLYVAPVMKPRPWYRHPRPEEPPVDALLVDVIHQAVRRMLGKEGQTPSAPTVRVINLSIGDAFRPFFGFLSALARLIDWLSWKYSVLFVVSAGNQTDELRLTISPDEFRVLGAEARQRLILQAVTLDARNRRLLAPAESVNALTVGSSHYDNTSFLSTDHRLDPYLVADLPGVYSPSGAGFRRAIKPDILLPGGRGICEVLPRGGNDETCLALSGSGRPPGLKVACPGTSPGQLDAACHTTGTSNSAALTTHIAAQLIDVIDDLRSRGGRQRLPEQHTAVLLKALLAHGARWGDVRSLIEQVLSTEGAREKVGRFLGYGAVEAGRVFACTAERATLLGSDVIREGDVLEYQIPLPQALSGLRMKKRLTYTLAWITPTNPGDRRYRRARLWVDPVASLLKVMRSEADHHACRRGTLQHEILESDKAVSYSHDGAIKLKVGCEADAGQLHDAIPYALVVSLEVAEGLGIPIYEEIRDRLQVQARVRVGTRVEG